MRIDIRPANSSDIEQISGIVDACWTSCFSGFLPQPVMERFTGEHRRAEFSRQLSYGAAIYVLLVDGVITAVCAGKACGKNPFAEHFEIVQLYVAPEKQGRGYGKKLLMHTLRQARRSGLAYAALETAAENRSARAFYQRFGFEEQKNAARTVDGVEYVTYRIDF